MKKRFLAVFLALALCVGLMPTAAFAADSDFVIENGVLTKYNGPGGDVVIPDGVTEISGTFLDDVFFWKGAFYGCTSLTSVTLPTSVTSIGENAFRNCDSLTSVTIPNSVTSIGWGAFLDCTSLTSVTIGNGVTSIGDFAFDGTPWLENQGGFLIVNGILFDYPGDGGDVTIPNSVTSIGWGAFLNCTSLTSVTIPNGVTEIGAFAFYDCTSLTSVIIPASVKAIGFAAFDMQIRYMDGAENSYSETLEDIYYGGTKEQWDAISINDENLTLETATIHYNSGILVKFPDLKPNGFYVDAVDWAVTNGITTGKTATTFAPNENCTHGQILTFLWRAAGEPESSAKPPISMKGNEFYYKAVKWAAEKGMIGGDFDPSAPCNRAYAVQYIWQAMGKPAPSKASPFTDIPAHWSSATAAAWAAGKGVTTGTTATTFNPGGICNRGQIVTFLYRAYK